MSEISSPVGKYQKIEKLQQNARIDTFIPIHVDLK